MSLFTEFAAANGRLHDGAVEWVIRHGVPEAAIWTAGHSLVGVGRIEADSAGRFQITDDGRPAIILTVTSLNERTAYEEPLDTLVDIVAWDPAEPGRWFLRRGDAPILNPEAIERAVFLNEPLQLWESPLGWLQGGMVGSVILDWTSYLPFWFPPKLEIHCATSKLGHRLLTQLREQRDALPLIRVPEARDAA